VWFHKIFLNVSEVFDKNIEHIKIQRKNIKNPNLNKFLENEAQQRFIIALKLEFTHQFVHIILLILQYTH